MKKFIESIKELRKKPYGNAVLFFGFYLIFFTIIAIMARTSNFNANKENNNSSIAINNLEKYNYSFEYKVILDNNTYSYTGSKKDNTIYYTYNGKNYYTKDNKSYVKDDDWEETDNPIKFFGFIGEANINNIINSSYIDSMNNYVNYEVVYNLLVSSNTLNKVINGEETDYDDVPNKIKVSVNNKFISEIDYDLNSYCKSSNLCNNKLEIIINYKEFSEIS